MGIAEFHQPCLRSDHGADRQDTVRRRNFQLPKRVFELSPKENTRTVRYCNSPGHAFSKSRGEINMSDLAHTLCIVFFNYLNIEQKTAPSSKISAKVTIPHRANVLSSCSQTFLPCSSYPDRIHFSSVGVPAALPSPDLPSNSELLGVLALSPAAAALTFAAAAAWAMAGKLPSLVSPPTLAWSR